MAKDGAVIPIHMPRTDALGRELLTSSQSLLQAKSTKSIVPAYPTYGAGSVKRTSGMIGDCVFRMR